MGDILRRCHGRLTSSERAQATIDHEIGAGHVAAVFRSQEQDGGGQFLRAPDAVEGSSRRELRPDRIRTFLRGRLRNR
jgi:hypothetical protein